MKVLILTYGRTGGKSLMEWISKELNLKSFHEPFHPDKLEYINGDNIIVKEFPHRIENLETFVNLFDKIICHRRIDLLECAISRTYCILNLHDTWHVPYNIDESWISENKKIIDENLEMIKLKDEELKKIKLSCLNTTYEGVFYNKEDIEKIKEYLDIKDLKHLDIIDINKKLRGRVA